MKANPDPPVPPCPQCQSERIRGELRTAGFDRRVFIRVWDDVSPGESGSFCLDVWLCPACGHVELRVPIQDNADCR